MESHCLNEFNFTKIPIFTILLFKVSREGILFNASITIYGNYPEENMYIEKSLLINLILLQIHYTDITNYTYNETGPWDFHITVLLYMQ